MRVLVCGGRHYFDHNTVVRTLDAIHVETPITAILHGGATGADALAGKWAALRNVSTVVFKADWQAHGRKAGPWRNMQMIQEGQPDLVVAFPGGRGTAHVIRLAITNNIKLIQPEQRQ